MSSKLATSIAALTVALLPFSALGADLGSKDSPSTDVPSERAVNWSGFYVGGQVGIGIASHDVTTIRTDRFDAIPSKCWANLGFNSSGATGFPDINIGDNDPTTPGNQDDRTHVVEAGANASITDVTKDECDDIRSSLGLNPAPTIPAGSGLSVDSGYDPAVAEHSVTQTATGNHSDSGLIGGGRVGFDYARGQILGGVFADYNFSDIEGKNGDWSVGGRLGLIVAPRTMAYVLAAYTQADYDEATFSGYSVGGGVEFAVTNNVFLGMEYAHSFYGKETLFDGAVGPDTHVKITDELDEDRIMATLKLKLNNGLGF